MHEKQRKELEKARELFFSWELHEAYAILRRFFDRLPFAPEKEHALYLSYFIRCLLELGKERELQFYVNQIEALYDKWKTPELAYQLAEVFCLGPEKSIPKAKQLLNRVISDSGATYLHPKAKLFLAYCYDYENADVASCRQIIDSVPDSEDRTTQLNIELWRIKVVRDEGNHHKAEASLRSFIGKIDPRRDWYAFFSARILLGGLFATTDRKEEAQILLEEMKKTVETSPFRTLKNQLLALEEKISVKPPLPELMCEQGIRAWRLSFKQRTIEIKHQTSAARLFEMFTKKNWIEKSQLAKRLLKKDYHPQEDDSKIHFQVHNLRKLLVELDCGMDPICFEEGGYRLVPSLKILEGEI